MRAPSASHKRLQQQPRQGPQQLCLSQSCCFKIKSPLLLHLYACVCMWQLLQSWTYLVLLSQVGFVIRDFGGYANFMLQPEDSLP